MSEDKAKNYDMQKFWMTHQEIICCQVDASQKRYYLQACLYFRQNISYLICLYAFSNDSGVSKTL